MSDFEKLFEDNREFIFKYLMKLSRNYSLAEELTQETFFRAYMNYSSLRDREKAPSWLCRIAKNTYYAWCGRQGRQESLDELDLADSGENIESAFVQKETAKNALKHLQELGEPYKDVFMLSVFGDFSLKEISRLFGKSESWARVTFYRAKQKLSEKMR